MNNLPSFIYAFVGVLLHSLGVILQKKGSEKLDFKWMLNIKNLIKIKIDKSLLIWVLGLILAYIISVIPTGIASKDMQPYVVSAISGFGIILTVIFSGLFLKEKLFSSDIFYSLVIIGLIALICLYQRDMKSMDVNYRLLVLFGILPVLALIPLFEKKLSRKRRAALISIFSGLTGGLTYVFLNLAAKAGLNGQNSLFGSIYLYLFIIVGFISGFSLQAAYKYGDIVDIMPLQIASSIIYPLLCSYLIYDQRIPLVQSVLIILTGICCWIMVKHRAKPKNKDIFLRQKET